MNLREVYDPVMRAFGADSPYASLPDRATPTGYRPDWRAALARGRALAKRKGIAVVTEHSLFFDAAKNAYSFNFRSSRDFTDKGGWSAVLFYPDGTLARTIIADGGLDDGGADNWFMALHMAQIGGMPYRIFVSGLGLLITMLSVTGIVIWMRKRSARLASAARLSAR
jgi:PepSY-associated TM region